MPSRVSAPPGKARLRLRVDMETLGGFPNLPALWLRRAKPGSAYATGNGLTQPLA
jgi:hypothetical protein